MVTYRDLPRILAGVSAPPLRIMAGHRGGLTSRSIRSLKAVLEALASISFPRVGFQVISPTSQD